MHPTPPKNFLEHFRFRGSYPGYLGRSGEKKKIPIGVARSTFCPLHRQTANERERTRRGVRCVRYYRLPPPHAGRGRPDIFSDKIDFKFYISLRKPPYLIEPRTNHKHQRRQGEGRRKSRPSAKLETGRERHAGNRKNQRVI